MDLMNAPILEVVEQKRRWVTLLCDVHKTIGKPVVQQRDLVAAQLVGPQKSGMRAACTEPIPQGRNPLRYACTRVALQPYCRLAASKCGQSLSAFRTSFVTLPITHTENGLDGVRQLALVRSAHHERT